MNLTPAKPVSQSGDSTGLQQPMRGLDCGHRVMSGDEMTEEESPITQTAGGALEEQRIGSLGTLKSQSL